MAEFISREATIKRIKEVYCVGCNSYHCVKCSACGTGDAIDIIEDAPAADVAPVRHGRWMHEETEGGFHIWRCSRCGRGMNDNPEGIDLHCYHCGAKMDGGDN